MTERSAAVGFGTVGAVISALPAVPRVVEAGASALPAFLALAGGTALVLGPALVLAEGLRTKQNGFRASLVGFAFAAAPLALLADVLKRGTHHRPLGAATFAALALALTTGAVVVASFILHVAESGTPARRRAVLAIAAVAALGSVGFVLVRALSTPALVPHVLDGLRALATATLCHLLLRLPRAANAGRRAGTPLWVAVVVSGFVVNRGATLAAVHAAAPVLGGPVAWF